MPRSVRTVFYRAPRSNDADSNTGSLGWVEPFAKPIGFAAIDGRCRGSSSIQISNSRGTKSSDTVIASAAKQSIAQQARKLDCFAALAMTLRHSRHDSAISRRDASELCVVALQNKRAQGKPGARCTRGPVCDCYWQKGTRAYRFSGGIPTFPARWVTAYTVLSPVTGFLATVIRRKCCFPRT